jgi:hypothetical protein
MATTAHHHLIVVNLEARQRSRVAHFDLIPGDVVDPAGVFIDEVVMVIRLRIEEHRVGSEMHLPQEPFLHEEIERVVDGRSGDHGEILPNAGPHLVGRGMLAGVEHVCGDGDALRRGLDAMLLENGYDVCLHAASANGYVPRLDFVKGTVVRGTKTAHALIAVLFCALVAFAAFTKGPGAGRGRPA